MKITSTFLLAALVFGLARVSYAAENSEPSGADQKNEGRKTEERAGKSRQRSPREAGEARRGRMDSDTDEVRVEREYGRREGTGRRRDLLVAGGTHVGAAQGSMLTLMFNDPEVSQELGLDAEERSKIEKIFAEADEAIKAKHSELRKAAEEQTWLISTRAPEADVMKAVEVVGGLRTDIAKLQTRKVIELRKHLTDEDIKKIDAVRRDKFRMRDPGQRPAAGEERRSGEGRGAKKDSAEQERNVKE